MPVGRSRTKMALLGDRATAARRKNVHLVLRAPQRCGRAGAGVPASAPSSTMAAHGRVHAGRAGRAQFDSGQSTLADALHRCRPCHWQRSWWHVRRRHRASRPTDAARIAIAAARQTTSCGMRRGFLPRGLSDTCPQAGAGRCTAACAGWCPTTLTEADVRRSRREDKSSASTTVSARLRIGGAGVRMTTPPRSMGTKRTAPARWTRGCIAVHEPAPGASNRAPQRTRRDKLDIATPGKLRRTWGTERVGTASASHDLS